jgi:hypothetical protein
MCRGALYELLQTQRLTQMLSAEFPRYLPIINQIEEKLPSGTKSQPGTQMLLSWNVPSKVCACENAVRYK